MVLRLPIRLSHYVPTPPYTPYLTFSEYSFFKPIHHRDRVDELNQYESKVSFDDCQYYNHTNNPSKEDFVAFSRAITKCLDGALDALSLEVSFHKRAL